MVLAPQLSQQILHHAVRWQARRHKRQQIGVTPPDALHKAAALGQLVLGQRAGLVISAGVGGLIAGHNCTLTFI